MWCRETRGGRKVEETKVSLHWRQAWTINSEDESVELKCAFSGSLITRSSRVVWSPMKDAVTGCGRQLGTYWISSIRQPTRGDPSNLVVCLVLTTSRRRQSLYHVDAHRTTNLDDQSNGENVWKQVLRRIFRAYREGATEGRKNTVCFFASRRLHLAVCLQSPVPWILSAKYDTSSPILREGG